VALSRARERLLRRIGSRKGREAEGVVRLEGPRAVAAALDLGAEFVFVLLEEDVDLTSAPDLPGRLERAGVQVETLPRESFREWAETGSPQGVLGVAREPRPPLPPPLSAPGGSEGRSVLLLDGVQDPGNVGTLIRSAAALGAERVIALDGTADPWGNKAVRASAGLAFGVPVHVVSWPEVEAWLSESGLVLLVADREGEDVRAWLTRGALPPGRGWALLMGNEGSGPRPGTLQAADARIAIPLPPIVESLNVAMAGTLLLWALGPGRAEPTPPTEDLR